MTEQALHLGVDVGTTAVKAAVFESEGACVAAASVNAETLSPEPGWSEQSMEAVWLNVRDAVRGVAGKIAGRTVDSIGVVGQGDGLWALDAGKAPIRNAILWNDQRADAITRQWIETGVSDALAQTCRTAVWPGTSAAAYAWLRQEEPEAAGAIAHVCNAKDWVGYRLTGTLATDLTDAGIPFLDLDTKAYADEALRICGASDLRDTLLTPRLSDERLGELSPHAAEQLGLSPGIPVAVGAIDLAAMHVGAGLNDVGSALLILGTTAVVSTVVQPFPPRETPIGATIFHPKGDRWLNAQAPQSGASALDWFAARFPDTGLQGATDAVEAAGQAPPGANGVVFHPYLTGERAPFVAPEATGAFLGLRATTTTADLARAVLEGVAYCLRHCLDETDSSPRAGFVATGGGARSALWRQILADVLGAPVQTLGEDDLGLRGAALLGAGAAGLRDPYVAPARHDISSRHDPNEESMAIYETGYRTFRASVDALRPTWRAIGDAGG